MRKSAMAVALIVFLAPAAAMPQAKSGKSGVYEQLNLFGEAFERIRHDAVEPVADGKLVQTAITGMLAGLDPHSVYLTESEYKALQTRTPDDSASTGIAVTLDNGQVKVVAPQAGSKLIGFVVDLRNNPGGSFDNAVKAADAFIDKGDITVVKSRKADGTKRIAATPGDLANALPIVALVNGGTAREAELVAGALQDNKRAVLLGTKTFGESAIETIIPLNGNGAIKLTTARFMTPSGRAIEGRGRDPDLTVSPLKLEKVAQADHRREADLRGALKNPDSQPKGATPGGGDKTAPGADKQPAAGATPSKSEQPNVAAGD